MTNDLTPASIAGLHPDLAPHVVTDPLGGHMIRHPLLCQTLFPEAIEQTNRTYLSRLDGVAGAESERNWHQYVFRHERPYRLDALQEIESACTWDEWRRLVRDVWMDGEQVWQREEDWRDLWPPGAGWHDVVMDESERDALAGLPDPVPVFRGYSHGPGARGLSWTTDRAKAEWFARRFAVVDGAAARVAVGTVPKALVIAYLLERGESEVLAWPEHVSVAGVEVIDEQEERS